MVAITIHQPYDRRTASLNVYQGLGGDFDSEIKHTIEGRQSQILGGEALSPVHHQQERLNNLLLFEMDESPIQERPHVQSQRKVEPNA
jgi:hypothetical protein